MNSKGSPEDKDVLRRALGVKMTLRKGKFVALAGVLALMNAPIAGFALDFSSLIP